MHPSAPAPTPRAVYESTVRAAWIDNNDHMNLAYYVLVFTDALDALRAELGLPGPLRLTQTHTVYQREVTLGDPLRVVTHGIGADSSRLHLFLEMLHADDEYRAATFEVLAEHDGPLGAEVGAWIDACKAATPPAGVGRRVAMPVAQKDLPG